MVNWPSLEGRALAIVGPTASGKSALAMQLAQRWPCEIISMDSALVYRGMDIGTAKPSRTELAQVPHHLIDILDPAQSYSAAQFAQDAQRLMEDIFSRNRVALLVGGTMLYLKALISGMDAMPAAQPQIRAAIDEEAARVGWPAMHAKLALVDPLGAQRLSPNDSQRIQRALEIYRVSGQSLSSYQKGRRQGLGDMLGDGLGDGLGDVPKALRELPVISLEPGDRAWLHERIAQRFAQMLQAGLVEEVMRLRSRTDLHLNLPAMRCVGYRQTWQMLDGDFPAAALLDKGIAATRQLAKRQMTWQRSMRSPQVNKYVLDPQHDAAQEQAFAWMAAWRSALE